MRIVVIDTNVLLADPESLFAFPESDVVIPETVLSELDKLKTSRVDPDLRYRGREVSRILFDLSEQAPLTDGVDLPNGSHLRVVGLDSNTSLPEGLGTRNSDDRILAVAYQVGQASPDDECTMITNDLNMLLKAQTYSVAVERYGEGVEGSFSRKYIIRPFQRYRIPLTILSMSLALSLTILGLSYMNRTAETVDIPQEFKDLLNVNQQQALDHLTTLEKNPNDAQALLGMGNLYFDRYEISQGVRDAQLGIRYLERYLVTNPDDPGPRVDMAALLFYTGRTDAAIQEVTRVLEKNPEHVRGNYNLGVFYWRGLRDFPRAIKQFERVVQLTQNDHAQSALMQSALSMIEQVKKDAVSASGGTPGSTTTTQ